MKNNILIITLNIIIKIIVIVNVLRYRFLQILHNKTQHKLLLRINFTLIELHNITIYLLINYENIAETLYQCYKHVS